MKNIFSFLCVCVSLLVTTASYGQFNRYDSTLKMGRTGYRVICSNKSLDQNELAVRPIGFDKDARELKFYIKGRVQKVEIDDLNNNNFPDIVVYIFSGIHSEYGNVIAFVSVENKTFMPVAVPDASMNGKISDGYKGHDDFQLMEGTLMQRFPIYKQGDSTSNPSGGKRTVQYGLVGSENAGYKFQLLRFYDTK
ncbi:MAG: hypothetical protein JST75_14675 [Bacteroidetes bacterium]|nr:hypothetical protein [Bacteroidota bacterium]